MLKFLVLVCSSVAVECIVCYDCDGNKSECGVLDGNSLAKVVHCNGGVCMKSVRSALNNGSKVGFLYRRSCENRTIPHDDYLIMHFHKENENSHWSNFSTFCESDLCNGAIAKQANSLISAGLAILVVAMLLFIEQ